MLRKINRVTLESICLRQSWDTYRNNPLLWWYFRLFPLLLIMWTMWSVEAPCFVSEFANWCCVAIHLNSSSSLFSTISRRMLTSICSLLFSTEVDLWTASIRDLLSEINEILTVPSGMQSNSSSLSRIRIHVCAASTAARHSAESDELTIRLIRLLCQHTSE